jgi:hypothetical protein
VERSLDSFSLLHCNRDENEWIDKIERSIEKSRVAETLCILFFMNE